MDFIKKLNQKLKADGRTLVIGKAPKNCLFKDHITAYIADKPKQIFKNRETNYDIYLVFTYFPVSQDSMMLSPAGREEQAPSDWNDKEAFFEFNTPSLSKYGFPSNPKLMKKLESVAKNVNDSMEYDFKAAKLIVVKNQKCNDNLEERVEQFVKNAPYRPTGKETQKGICSDAGCQIRDKLNKIKDVKFHWLKTKRERHGLDIEHDTTFVYNPETLEWAVLNSKSPYLQFNVFPKELLTKDYGFRNIKEYFGID